MTRGTVLISGAGIAGPTLAYWLARNGWRPSIVELAQGQRSSGSPVDIRGAALPVVERMGLISPLTAARTRARSMVVIGTGGRPAARVAMGATRSAAGTREIEIPRGDLAAILHQAVRDDVEICYDDTITDLRQDAGGVDVTFHRAGPRRFDLVVGADGLHSTVRRLAFGPETMFVRHTGVHVATMPYEGPLDHPDDVVMYNVPGRLVAIHPSARQAMAAFIFRGGAIGAAGHRDTGRHRQIVTHAYAGAGWRVPELLAALRQSTELYFDSVSKVRLPTWSRGRVTLLGDAASCVSLFGDGSSLAIAGAYTLATALADQAGTGRATAFARYESEHRPRTRRKQFTMRPAAAMIVPRTGFGIALRNLAARAVGSPVT